MLRPSKPLSQHGPSQLTVPWSAAVMQKWAASANWAGPLDYPELFTSTCLVWLVAAAATNCC